jgi:hypothetical protein
VSRAGHELGRASLAGLPRRLSLQQLFDRRLRAEVAAYNAEPGERYVGLVQPEDAIRYSDGHRMARPRDLDADRFVLAFEQAVAAGLVRVRVGDLVTDDLTTEVDLEVTEVIEVLLARPVVARDP